MRRGSPRMNMDGRINFESASILLVDSSNNGMSVLTQIFAGFGAHQVQKCKSIADARELVLEREFHLIVVNDKLSDGSGFKFVRWLRRLEGQENTFCPVVILSGYVRKSMVQKSRDCGANFLVAKPISPAVLLERVLWIGREKRPFVYSDHYAGPDRRFHDPKPHENLGRRRNDHAGECDGGEDTFQEEFAA